MKKYAKFQCRCGEPKSSNDGESQVQGQQSGGMGASADANLGTDVFKSKDFGVFVVTHKMENVLWCLILFPLMFICGCVCCNP